MGSLLSEEHGAILCSTAQPATCRLLHVTVVLLNLPCVRWIIYYMSFQKPSVYVDGQSGNYVIA